MWRCGHMVAACHMGLVTWPVPVKSHGAQPESLIHMACLGDRLHSTNPVFGVTSPSCAAVCPSSHPEVNSPLAQCVLTPHDVLRGPVLCGGPDGLVGPAVTCACARLVHIQHLQRC
jgi:hypothetical protein